MSQKSLLSFFTKNNSNFLNGRIILEGIVVSTTEYIMLGAFVLINFLINHYYGTEVVGIYFLSYSIAQIGILGVGGVFSLLMRRDLSINHYDSNNYLSKVQLLRFSNLLIVLFISIIAIVLFYQPLRSNLLFVLLMIGAKGFDALSESYYTAYQTLNRISDYSIFKILNATAFILVSVFVCINHYNIEYLYWSQFFCAILIFAINFHRWNQTKNVSLSIERKALQKVTYRFLIIESFPLIINALVFQLGLRLNSILIFDSIGEKNLGIFSIVVITIGMFTGVSNALALVFFGRLSRIFVDQPQAFLKRLHQTLGLFLIIGVSFFILYLLLIPVIEYLFGLTIDHQLYQIMSSAIPFMFIVSSLGSIFTIIKKQKLGMYLSVVVLFFNLLAYYLFIERYGLIGAGYAFLITFIFQSVIFYFASLMYLRKS
ncbi:MAG: polysaccharide biosynthesis C-terminal domain-containing protein [Acidobacteria bacterium]|nr:polysaccharide biosynthesis C-terminal domain-containing protein [Acidobacteriota bacterium]